MTSRDGHWVPSSVWAPGRVLGREGLAASGGSWAARPSSLLLDLPLPHPPHFPSSFPLLPTPPTRSTVFPSMLSSAAPLTGARIHTTSPIASGLPHVLALLSTLSCFWPVPRNPICFEPMHLRPTVLGSQRQAQCCCPSHGAGDAPAALEGTRRSSQGEHGLTHASLALQKSHTATLWPSGPRCCGTGDGHAPDVCLLLGVRRGSPSGWDQLMPTPALWAAEGPWSQQLLAVSLTPVSRRGSRWHEAAGLALGRSPGVQLTEALGAVGAAVGPS